VRCSERAVVRLGLWRAKMGIELSSCRIWILLLTNEWPFVA
jgi:hypothetical protein